jgi:hypothetical protein
MQAALAMTEMQLVRALPASNTTADTKKLIPTAAEPWQLLM